MYPSFGRDGFTVFAISIKTGQLFQVASGKSSTSLRANGPRLWHAHTIILDDKVTQSPEVRKRWIIDYYGGMTGSMGKISKDHWAK